MLTTYRNKFFVSLVVLQLVIGVACAASVKNEQLELNLNKGARVSISLSDKKISAKFHSKKIDRLIETDKILAAHLLRTDEVSYLFKVPSNTRELFVVLSREPSRQNRSSGFCGAGYEDFLLLIEVKKKQVVLADKFLLQSCLESILLDVDEGENPLQAIALDKSKSTITFSLLNELDRKKKIISIIDGHFILIVQ